MAIHWWLMRYLRGRWSLGDIIWKLKENYGGVMGRRAYTRILAPRKHALDMNFREHLLRFHVVAPENTANAEKVKQTFNGI